MATAVDDDIASQQHQVQRLLGRCLLRLQQYEHLLKTVVAGHELSGTLHTFESNRAARIRETSSRTLGQLAKEMFGAVIFATEADDPTRDDGNGDEVWIRTRVRMQLSEQAYAAQRAEMEQLVGLRNRLVHHFIEDHDVWTAAGCQAAQQALVDAYGCIDGHVQRLGQWATEMQQARQQMAALVQTEAFADCFVNGILPDGSVFWPGAGIVCALREAARELGRDDGWTRVADAGAWIAARHPTQLPARYRCRSWRQALHESGLFELRKREVHGRRSTWYRERMDVSGPTLHSIEVASA